MCMAGRPKRVSDERIHGPSCQDPTEGCPTLEYFKAVPLTEDKGGESVFGRKQTNWQGKEMAAEPTRVAPHALKFYDSFSSELRSWLKG